MSTSYVRYPASEAGIPSFPLVGPDGSAAAPTYSFTNSTNTGMYYSTNTLHFSVAGSDQFTLASSGAAVFSGNVTGGAHSLTFNSVIVGSAANTISGLSTMINGAGTLTLPTSTDTLTGRATTDTLTNKTLTSPVISTISNTGTLTLPTSTDTLVGRATTDTLTNKTLTAPVISTISNTGTLTLPTSTDTLVGRATTDTLTNKTIVGSVTGTNPAAGNLGEVLISTVSTNTNTAATGVYFDATSLDITAGIWEVVGIIQYAANAATLTSGFEAGINTTTGNSNAGEQDTVNWSQGTSNPNSGENQTIITPPFRVNISGTTTYFLKGSINFSAGQPKYKATLRALRVA